MNAPYMKLARTFLPLASILLLGSACAPASSDDAGAAAGDVTGGTGSVCATLDYGHTVTPENFYRRFETDAKAGEFVAKLIAQGKLAAASGPKAKFVEIARDPRVIRLVGEVFAGYKKAFPRETAGMTAPPPIAIVETDIVNAYALGPGFVEDDAAPVDKAPWVFVVHTALLAVGNTDNELRGLFAHELGHLVLRTFLPEIRAHVRSQYKVGPNEDGILGEAQPSDPILDDHVEEIRKRRDRVGALPTLGLNVLEGPRLPVPGKLLTLLHMLVNATEAATPGACATATAHMNELATAQKALLPNLADGNAVARSLSAEEQAHVDQLSDAIASELRACIPSDEGSLMEVTAILNQLPPESVDPAHPQHARLLALMLDAEKQVDAEMPQASLIDRVLTVQAKLRAELIALENDPQSPIDQLRVYDYEEDADDAAVRVLAALGEDPIGNGMFLVRAGLPPELQQPCLDAVAAHRPIPYGRFIDPHPATCWRYYHTTQFAQGLRQCSALPPATKTANGSGRASVADKSPVELIEKGYGRR